MSWEQAHPKRYLMVGEAATVSLCWRGGKLAARITLGSDVVDKIGWKKGDSAILAWGLGSDEGKVRLTLGEPGFKLRHIGGSTHTLSISTTSLPLRAAIERRCSRCEVEYLKQGGLSITLPPWFYRPVDRYEDVSKKDIARENSISDR